MRHQGELDSFFSWVSLTAVKRQRGPSWRVCRNVNAKPGRTEIRHGMGAVDDMPMHFM